LGGNEAAARRGGCRSPPIRSAVRATTAITARAATGSKTHVRASVPVDRAWIVVASETPAHRSSIAEGAQVDGHRRQAILYQSTDELPQADGIDDLGE
jgi:hypothetical protein